MKMRKFSEHDRATGVRPSVALAESPFRGLAVRKSNHSDSCVEVHVKRGAHS